MQVIVLSAGVGTRLFPISNFLPKAMIPVGEKPCIRWIVERIKKQGFDDILLRINEKDAPLFKHEFRDLNLAVSCADRPYGTAGELLEMRKRREIHGEDFILYYGDELTPIDLKRLEKFHQYFKHPLVTLALVQGMKLDVGTVSLDNEGNVLSFEEKPPLDKAIWAGICIFNETIFNGPWLSPDTDLAKDVFPKMTGGKKSLIKAAVLSTEWLDIGTLSHWERANKLACEGKLCE